MGGVVGRLALFDHARGNLQEIVADRIPVLSDEKRVVVGVNWDNGDRARVVNDLPGNLATVRSEQRINARLYDAS